MSFRCGDCNKVIEIKVGEEPESLYVHDSLFTSHSRLFERIINGDWKESEERVIELPKDDSRTVVSYVHFLYTHELSL